MKRNVIKSVVTINLLAIAVLTEVSLRSYLLEVRMSQLLGNKPPYPWHDNSFVGPAIWIAVLVCGTVLELLKSRLAVFVNLGVPCCLLVIVLAGCIRGWRDNPQEVQISLILVALPLLVLSTSYAIFYRRKSIHFHQHT